MPLHPAGYCCTICHRIVHNAPSPCRLLLPFQGATSLWLMGEVDVVARAGRVRRAHCCSVVVHCMHAWCACDCRCTFGVLAGAVCTAGAGGKLTGSMRACLRLSCACASVCACAPVMHVSLFDSLVCVCCCHAYEMLMCGGCSHALQRRSCNTAV
jgi:hypothetical protein